MDNEGLVSSVFRIVTRGVALLALILALDNLLSLIPDLLAVHHHWQMMRLIQDPSKFKASEIARIDEIYWFRYYMTWTCGRVIVLAALLYVADWLYRGGKGLQKFVGVTVTSD